MRRCAATARACGRGGRPVSRHRLSAGCNPGCKLSASEPNAEPLRPLQSSESQRVRLDRSGWGPGGRRFKSCLPDHDLPAKRDKRSSGSSSRGAFWGAKIAPQLHPAASRFGSPSRVGNLRPQGLEPGGRWPSTLASSIQARGRDRRRRRVRCSSSMTVVGSAAIAAPSSSPAGVGR